MTRDKALALVWRHKHRDYKGHQADGTKAVLVLREGGTWSVPLSDLTDDEIRRDLPRDVRDQFKGS